MHKTPTSKKRAVDRTISRGTSHESEWAADVMSTTEPWITLGRSREQCVAVMRNPAHLLFVARGSKAEPLGFILLHPEGLAASPYVRSLAVAPAARGLGIGTELLHFAEELFRGKSRHIFLCVSSFNHRARALYKRLGYTRAGELKDYVIAGASELLLYKRLDQGPRALPGMPLIDIA